jgi:DNA-binding NtrC family response regulator
VKVSTVLLVDDNPDLGEGLRLVLDDEGYDVALATCGSEAISLSREKRFDITFMDMKLPDMTGIEALMEIIKLYPDARVIMMSGYRVEELLDEAMKRGAESVLAKPFTMEQMLAEIDRD